MNLDPKLNFETNEQGAKVAGRVLALDLGSKRVGAAISDELRITANPLPFIERRSWKDLLRRVVSLIETYDARALVIGLPLNLDGSEGGPAQEARRIAENFRRSLSISIYLQDERLTTLATEIELKAEGRKPLDIANRIDSESAATILRDFLATSP